MISQLLGENKTNYELIHVHSDLCTESGGVRELYSHPEALNLLKYISESMKSRCLCVEKF